MVYLRDMDTNERDLITRHHAANLYGVTVRTIDRWASAGLIKKYENPAGHVRVSSIELRAMVTSYTAV